MFPNWIIAGAPKAGTSSLFRWLADHPEVCGPAEKETYYFVDPETHMFKQERSFLAHGLPGYAKIFAHCDCSVRIIIESTPSYIYSETALRELPNLPSDPKFIFVLREPVAQLRSLFSYFQQNWNWIPRHMTFRDFISAAETGAHQFRGNELATNALNNACYANHLRRWKAAVGGDRMVILLFEDLVERSQAVMRAVSSRMGIAASFYDTYAFAAENTTYSARIAVLQDLNIMVRRQLPRGVIYNRLRGLYRKLNTKTPEKPAADMELDRALAERYIGQLAALETEFGLDLTKWRGALIPRTFGPTGHFEPKNYLSQLRSADSSSK